jgi:hypothetical protein
MQKRIGLALLLAATMGLAAGCGSAKSEAPSTGAAQRGMTATPAPAVKDQSGNMVSVSTAEAPKTAPGMPGPGGNAAVPEGAVARKEIRNANFELRVKNVDEADQKLRAALQTAGGFVQSSQVEGQKESGRRMTITIRVPAAGYESTFKAITDLGEEITRKEWTEDVTQEYYDLEARIKVKEAHLAQLKKLYEKAGTIPEMIQLEQEIARVQAEIDSLKGRYQFLSNQVAFSTMTIYLYEPGAPAPIQPPKTVWERMQRGFVGSWNGMVNFAGNLLVFLVSVIPVAVPLGIVGGAGTWGYRTYRRRKGGSPTAPASGSANETGPANPPGPDSGM